MHRDSSYVNYYFLNIYDAFRQCDTTEEGGSSLTRVLSCERDAIKSIIAIVYESLHVPSKWRRRNCSRGQVPQVVLPHTACVNQGGQWLHYVCTEEALQELVAA